MKSTVNAIVTLVVFLLLVAAIKGGFGDEVRDFSTWIFFPWLIQVFVSNWSGFINAVDKICGIKKR